MTLELPIDPETERRLIKLAEGAGMQLSDFVLHKLRTLPELGSSDSHVLPHPVIETDAKTGLPIIRSTSKCDLTVEQLLELEQRALLDEETERFEASLRR